MYGHVVVLNVCTAATQEEAIAMQQAKLEQEAEDERLRILAETQDKVAKEAEEQQRLDDERT